MSTTWQPGRIEDETFVTVEGEHGPYGIYPPTEEMLNEPVDPEEAKAQEQRLRKAWARPETVVVQEIFWTPAARHADIVLPVTTVMERNDIAIERINIKTLAR